ncbi:Aste57867_22795 [Aphanomyces stellatus]|uniref:Aste57867_22795 protein n=1 Tax=Aphanomyces stellatus TaxID=120398 RepID=A0A485LLR4_9STRA|nr:hypothetical protein As57867_022725 [Aphanomyces stellatus]VFT99448.1 Aste57867_22795 [Aphanomyces stellatus]
MHLLNNSDANRLDLEERVSYIQSATGKQADVDGDYNDMKTPGELEGGALVEGGAVPLVSLEAFALYCQYGAIGVVLNLLPNLSYPIFNVYLNMEGYQLASYGVLVNLGWSYKVIFGMLTDCFPIFGFRRKSWMIIGWSICALSCGIMAFSPIGEPFCNRANEKYSKYCGMPLEKVPQEAIDVNFNLNAPDVGGLYILLSMLASFGYVTAACASDAMVVEYAQREPAAIRGRIQTAIYTVRTMTGLIPSIVIGFGLNSANYSGSFSFSMGPNVPYMICLIPCVLVVLSTIFLMVEVKKPGIPIGVWWGSFWELLQKRVMWQICAFRFINNVFWTFGTVAGSPITNNWAQVENINSAIMDLVSAFIFSGILASVAKWGLHWNWRVLIAAGSIGIMLIDAPVMFLTIWNVVRNQWFYTGVTLADNIPSGVRFIVATYCAVEIADVGVEGATYGLVTTMNNLASPFSSVFYKWVNSYFLVKNNDIKKDTTEVRWDCTYVYLISYGCKLFSLVFLFMLPPQKKEMQELKKKGGKSKLAGYILVVLFVVALGFAMTSSFMAVYPATKCYRIAGGDGKFDSKTGACPRPPPRK